MNNISPHFSQFGKIFMAAYVDVIILPLQWLFRSSSKLIWKKMNGENRKSSQDTHFHTFAKSTKENQPSFQAATTSTDTWNYLKPEVY